MQLTQDEGTRYARQLMLPEVGEGGQRKLKSASVLCIGAGGLGSPLLIYLAAAGVGRLGIVDDDKVALSNLHRQVVHGTTAVGKLKTESARAMLRELNPHVTVTLHSERLTSANALAILDGYDVVVDATDNFPTRYLVNDACVWLKKPNVYGAIFRFEGQATVFAPSLGGPCYRCLYPEPPPAGSVPNCAEAGVLGVLPGIIGCLQTVETMKLILGQGQLLLGRLLLYDALQARFRELKLKRDPTCPVCGTHPTITKLIDYEAFCGLSQPADVAPNPDEVTVFDMNEALRDPSRHIVVVDVREPPEFLMARVEGTVQMPLSVLPQRFGELDRSRMLYLHCKSGVRSMKALKFLRQNGFENVKSVKGGITAWSDQVDSRVPKY